MYYPNGPPNWTTLKWTTPTVILLPLRPASHKNPQGRKLIHGTRPVGRKE